MFGLTASCFSVLLEVSVESVSMKLETGQTQVSMIYDLSSHRRTERFPGASGSGSSAMWIEYQKGKSVAQLVVLLPHSHSQPEGPGFDTCWGLCVWVSSLLHVISAHTYNVVGERTFLCGVGTS